MHLPVHHRAGKLQHVARDLPEHTGAEGIHICTHQHHRGGGIGGAQDEFATLARRVWPWIVGGRDGERYASLDGVVLVQTVASDFGALSVAGARVWRCWTLR